MALLIKTRCAFNLFSQWKQISVWLNINLHKMIQLLKNSLLAEASREKGHVPVEN